MVGLLCVGTGYGTTPSFLLLLPLRCSTVPEFVGLFVASSLGSERQKSSCSSTWYILAGIDEEGNVTSSNNLTSGIVFLTR